jgi:L-fucose isomerase-like protein
MADSKRLWIIIAAVVVVLVAGVVIVRAMNRLLPPPVQAVQKVLELRRDRSTDASAYAGFFADMQITKALVREASQASETTSSAVSPIPGWETPYVSAQATATADVVVVWKADRRFENWTKATLFSLEETSGRWVIVNAVELSSSVPPRSDTQR